MPKSLRLLFFFFNDTATTEIYTLSLHDALPISILAASLGILSPTLYLVKLSPLISVDRSEHPAAGSNELPCDPRSEEHTSELQSHLNLVCRLLLEKKKQMPNIID